MYVSSSLISVSSSELSSDKGNPSTCPVAEELLLLPIVFVFLRLCGEATAGRSGRGRGAGRALLLLPPPVLLPPVPPPLLLLPPPPPPPLLSVSPLLVGAAVPERAKEGVAEGEAEGLLEMAAAAAVSAAAGTAQGHGRIPLILIHGCSRDTKCSQIAAQGGGCRLWRCVWLDGMCASLRRTFLIWLGGDICKACGKAWATHV